MLASPSARAQIVDAPAPNAPPVKQRYLINKFPDKPTLAPKWTIPIDSLGFTAPGLIYLGSRNALVSLDFISEDRLLFTFRIPGLLHRDAANQESDEREIRAVVLALPQGNVVAESSWTVHDRVRYLWMLSNGHFLLRDRNNLLEGDASLTLKPYLDFPGALLWLDMDPSQQFLVTNSREPETPPQKSPATGDSAQASTSSTTAPSLAPNPDSAQDSTQDSQDSAAASNPPDLVVRVLQRKSGQVLLVSRVRAAVHLPINSLGYIENLRGRAANWMLDLSYFTGGTKMLGGVESSCEPEDDFLSEQEILVSACGSGGESKLVALTTAGRTLWISQAPPTEVWPRLTVAANGSRLAWATLDTDRAINSYAPMDADDVKEQSVTVFDAANGDIALVSPLSPIFDAGGNVAISPSGRRVALINEGVIQVFDLPAPPPLPADTAAAHPAH
ncbi:MAG: hypothetical protein WBC92_00390 [Terracidiphilus sp.]